MKAVSPVKELGISNWRVLRGHRGLHADKD